MNAAFDEQEQLKKFQDTRDEFKRVNAMDLARNPGTALFRFWMLRLLMGCYRELDSIAYRLRNDRR